MILTIREKVTPEQLRQMLEVYAIESYIKTAVDVRLGILVGGAEMHYECEEVLLEEGSRQEDVWGAGYYPATKRMRFDSFINIRPHQNRDGIIQDVGIREQVTEITERLLGGVIS